MNWQRYAACARSSTVRPEAFSPVDSRGRVDLDAARRVAAQVCGTCPVLASCFAAADDIKPEEVVLAGRWYPAANAVDKRPVYLLDDQRIEAAA